MNKYRIGNRDYKFQKKCTNSEMDSMLDYVLSHPNFEKPTPEKYYLNMIKEKNLKTSWSLLKWNMFYLRRRYFEAIKLQNMIDNGRNTENMGNVEDKMLEICPHFDILDGIFGKKPNRDIRTYTENFEEILTSPILDEELIEIDGLNEVIIPDPMDIRTIPNSQELSVSAKSFEELFYSSKSQELFETPTGAGRNLEKEIKQSASSNARNEFLHLQPDKKEYYKEKLQLEKEKFEFYKQLKEQKMKIVQETLQIYRKSGGNSSI
ncbi:uncharacterized protein LOC119688280 [Teleopsis dalmanni]|uniref:uncharacterized protein LOC119688280 n=1 Tax=Teleopsis dalmanni TaxID=139649 RepID=UPI0018CEEE14|nr:uncharacterized protein LOC119688280 [Teleopsis dalmanni]